MTTWRDTAFAINGTYVFPSSATVDVDYYGGFQRAALEFGAEAWRDYGIKTLGATVVIQLDGTPFGTYVINKRRSNSDGTITLECESSLLWRWRGITPIVELGTDHTDGHTVSAALEYLCLTYGDGETYNVEEITDAVQSLAFTGREHLVDCLQAVARPSGAYWGDDGGSQFVAGPTPSALHSTVRFSDCTDISDDEALEQRIINELQLVCYHDKTIGANRIVRLIHTNSVKRWGRKYLRAVLVPWITTAADAQAYAENVFTWYADPQPIIQFTKRDVGSSLIYPWSGRIRVRDADGLTVGASAGYTIQSVRYTLNETIDATVTLGPPPFAFDTANALAARTIAAQTVSGEAVEYIGTDLDSWAGSDDATIVDDGTDWTGSVWPPVTNAVDDRLFPPPLNEDDGIPETVSLVDEDGNPIGDMSGAASLELTTPVVDADGNTIGTLGDVLSAVGGALVLQPGAGVGTAGAALSDIASDVAGTLCIPDSAKVTTSGAVGPLSDVLKADAGDLVLKLSTEVDSGVSRGTLADVFTVVGSDLKISDSAEIDSSGDGAPLSTLVKVVEIDGDMYVCLVDEHGKLVSSTGYLTEHTVIGGKAYDKHARVW